MYTLTSTTSSSGMTVLTMLLGFGQVLDPPQAAPPVVFDDRAEGPEGGLVGPVEAAGPLAALHHEPCGLQHAQVLADGRPGHVELRRDVSRGQFPVPDELQDPQPAGRGDHLQRLHGCLAPRSLRRRARPLAAAGFTQPTYFR